MFHSLFTRCCLAAALLSLPGTAAQAADPCGAVGSPCSVAGGAYNIALPDRPKDRIPAFLFLHGLGGTGDKVLGNKRFRENITQLGYALIAPTGLSTGQSGRTNWSVRDGQPPMRDEEGFLTAVAADAADRFGVDRKRIILSGFSRGGSMVWDIACQSPETFAAYAPGGGGFWRPMARRCAGPVRLFHVHGWKDRTVPLEGRRIPGKTIHQGNLFAGIQTFGAANGCALERPLDASVDGPLWIKTWVGCREGSSLKFALHAGGHGLPKGWAQRIAAWFEETTPVN